MKLSILILSVPCRINQIAHLITSLNTQIIEQQAENDVEILYLGDSKTISVGEKRNILKRLATGQYICFIDDDDVICEDYLSEILKAIDHNRDIITFHLEYFLNGVYVNKWIPSLHMGQFEQGDIQFRKINHLCPHKKELADKIDFPNINFKEDFEYAQMLEKICQTEYPIQKTLYKYIFNTSNTQTQNGTATAYKQSDNN